MKYYLGIYFNLKKICHEISPVQKVWLSFKDWSRDDKVRSPLELVWPLFRTQLRNPQFIQNCGHFQYHISCHQIQLMLYRKWPQSWKKWGLRNWDLKVNGLSFDFEQIFWKCITFVLHTYIREYIGSTARVVTLQEPISLYFSLHWA